MKTKTSALESLFNKDLQRPGTFNPVKERIQHRWFSVTFAKFL